MFLLSIILIIISSYLITSVITAGENKKTPNFIYFLLINFAQIILTFEFLSLFGQIKEQSFIIINFIVFIAASAVCFIKKCFKNPFSNGLTELKKIKNAIKRDKMLKFLSFCFIVFLISQLAVIILFPVNYGDALSYYLPRVTSWIQQGSLNHFYTPDSRELIMPINMDLLYTYVLMFCKNEAGIGIFSYISYIGAIYVLYNLLSEIGFCIRKRLWAIFVFSSFAIIGTMVYSPLSDLCAGSLLLTCIYLYLISVKYETKTALYFSALACALAIGTKTTAIIALPSVLIILTAVSVLYGKKQFKTLKGFFLLFILNFIIFSSYNYILNFMEFHNPISCPEQLLLNKFKGGIKGYLCSLIKYIFAVFDFSGIENIDFYNNFITNLQAKVLGLIKETPNSYLSPFFNDNFKFNSITRVTEAALGALGLLAFLPSLICALFKRKSKKYILLSVFALTFIFNILLFSRVMVYTKYNLRYLTTFVIIALPILVLSYIKSNKNIYKWILCYFMTIYLFVLSHTKPVSLILAYSKFKVKNPASEHPYDDFLNINRPERHIYNYFIKKAPAQNNKIAVISQLSGNSVYDIEKLKLKGFILDKYPIDDIKNYNLRNYDYIISADYKSSTTNIKNYNNPECLYLDYEKNINTNRKSAKADCLVPFNWLYSQGFTPIKDINITEYKILEKTN